MHGQGPAVGGRIITLEKDRSRCGVVIANARASTVAERIEIRCGDALQSLAQIDGPVDMVFIDADKGIGRKRMCGPVA
jgi:predicted O-methyltransferase YrrM